MFTHLHLHTEYSLLDGLIKVKPLVKRLQELGMTSCAITDHGVMYGLYEFWSECKYAGIKPIIGCEVYIAARTRFDKDKTKDRKRYHLTLLAKNETGYHNLIKLSSLGHIEGFYSKPRVDKELLRKHSEGIIATTGCAASPVNRNLIHGNIEKAYEWARFFKEIYQDNLYVEIQRNGVKECEDAIPLMLQLAKDLDLPIVATCDSHYLNKGDHSVQEVNWCIRDAKLLSDSDRAKKWSEEFYIKSTEEMEELFKDLPEAIANTQKIADSVEEYSIKYDRVQPIFWNIPDGVSTHDMLVEKSYAGAAKIFTTNKDHHNEVICDEWINYEFRISDQLKKIGIIPEDTPSVIKLRKDIKDRIDEELAVIADKGYIDYFLVVSDFLNWAKANGILCGVRGSVGGSLVAYVTGITDIDPLRWELYFERFLNPQRKSPPDIDSDIQYDKRLEVVEYIKSRYGEQNCSLINALGRLKTRAAIRDVSRVMGINLKVADKLSKMVIVKFGKPYSAKEMMEKVSEFRDEVNSDPKLIEMIETVKKIENMPRQTGTHACGLLITPQPVIEYTPLQLDKEGRVTAQLEMKPIEELGLMKFDILGLINLSIIKYTLKIIESRNGLKIDIWKIPQDDIKTFELLQRGDTDAVFQLESEGMKEYLIKLKPTTLDDICFMCAAYRPGPMQFIQPYIDCKHGLNEPEYIIDELKPILKSTYGFAIYQEQVIRIAVDIAGYSMGEADLLRRAMGKKVKEIMDGEKIKFFEGCKKKGFSEEIAEKLFDYLMPFADYGFNKSHSAGYAHLAYQTAYLKAHYPLEFLAGLMQADLETPDKLKRDMKIAKEKKIQILSPNVNSSGQYFTIDDQNNVVFGLGGIKGISKSAMKELVSEREKNGKYECLDDIVFRLGSHTLPKSNLEILIKIGALSEFGNRAQLLQIVPDIYKKYNDYKAYTAQANFFELMDTTNQKNYEPTTLPPLEEVQNNQKIEWEMNHLNTFFSTHPLAVFTHDKFTPLSELHNIPDENPITVMVMVKEQKKINTKNGDPMSFQKIEDLSANSESVIFPKLYTKFAKMVEKQFAINDTIIIQGKVTSRNDKKSIIIDDIFKVNTQEDIDNFTPVNKPKFNYTPNRNNTTNIQPNHVAEPKPITELKIDLSGSSDKLYLSKAKHIIKENPGECKLVLKLKLQNEVKEISVANGISPKPEIIAFFENLIY